jgi:regulator of replication initiation timing
MKEKIEQAVDMFLRDRWCDTDESYEYKLDSIYSFRVAGDICNPTYYQIPHIYIYFSQNIDGLVTKLSNSYLFSPMYVKDADIRKTLIDGLYGQYQRLSKMEKDVEIGFGHYYSVLNDNEKLRKELQEEKAAHTETKARVIFATHILNGNREEATNEFTNEYDKQIKNLISENGKLNREIEHYKKSLSSWHSKFNKMV